MYYLITTIIICWLTTVVIANKKGRNTSLWTGLSLIITPIGTLILILFVKNLKKERMQAIDDVTDIVNKHIAVLTRKKNEATNYDDYGIETLNTKKWQKELEHFANVVIPQEIPQHTFSINNQDNHLDLVSLVDEKIAIYEQTLNERDIHFDDNMDGIEYEHFCSTLFTQNNWTSQVTKASGDQGADLIVKKDGVIGIVQCKRYSSTVGNKAVQEVFAAKEYYDAQLAIVVTNNSFTPSAKTLANKLKVKLIHHDDISTI